MIPTTIVDNFFESPTLIREYALSLDYSQRKENYPGIRTQDLSTVNPKLNELLGRKVFSLFFNLDSDRVGWDIGSGFQLTDASFECGWSHVDGSECQFAGVVYLNPDAPLNGGTSICKPKYKIDENLKKTFDDNFHLRNLLYRGEGVDLELYRAKRKEHNDHFDITLEVSNVFNRLFLYDANNFHKENVFFGEGKNARLTLVFFGNFVTYGNSKPPLTRLKSFTC